MTKLFRKILSAGLSASMIFSMATLPVKAAEEIPGWTVKLMNNVDATVSIDTEEKYSGEASLKIVNRSVSMPNVYLMVQTTVAMEAGRQYNISGMVKSEASTNLQFVVHEGGWERVSLTPFGKTYGWTNYEYTYIPKETKSFTFSLLVDGITNGAWFDDIQITDIKTGQKLITNSGFEGASSGVSNEGDAADASLYDTYKRIISSDNFSADDMTKVRGGFKYMTVYGADGIKIDGEMSDWDKYPVLAMPTLPTQYQVYIKDDKPKDVEAECKFAQDEENFYFVIRVKDDVFKYFPGVDEYWKGDSIQMAISDLNETYGTEMGFIHNPETGKGEIYSTGFTSEQMAKMDIATSQDGEYTTYEVKIPWEVKFSTGKPNQFLFDFLVNDNDGTGRRYCAELSPGISEGKSNKLFPTLEILEGQKDWYAWVQGVRTAETETEYTYEYYIVNEGSAKSFSIVNEATGVSETVTVPENSGIRKTFSKTFDAAGEEILSVKISAGEETAVSNISVKVTRKPPTPEYTQKLANTLRSQAGTIKSLIDKCEKKGIPTDYQMPDYLILLNFADYMEEDIKDGDLARVYYTEETTKQLFEKTKKELEDLLSGTKEPIYVPRYVTSKPVIDGYSEIATVEYKGEFVERPVFFVGYGHGKEVLDMMPNWSQWGVNAVQSEIGPRNVLERLGSWTMFTKGDHEFDFKINSEDKKDGNVSLEVNYYGQKEPEHYLSYYQTVPVTPGKSYVLTGKVKAEHSESFTVSASNWSNAVNLKGDYDWKDFKIDYTAPLDASSTIIRIIVEDIATGLKFDDFSFKEKDSDKELLSDPSFEKMSFEVDNYNFNEEAVQFTMRRDALEQAVDNNVAFSLLVSPHYFLNEIAKLNNLNIKTDGFLDYNINEPIARQVIEKHLRELVSRVKDYESLHDICLSNEPQFEINNCGDFYMNDWHTHLREIYNNDINELNKAYGTNYTAFEEVDMKNDFNTPAKQYDYKLLNDRIFAEWHQWMAEIIREIAPDIPLHSKIMGYTTSNYNRTFLQNNGTGYHGYQKFLDYHGCDYWNYEADDTVKPLVKIMWYDYMTSYGVKPVVNSEDHILPDRGTNYELCVSDYVSQDLWQGAIHGRVSSVMWIWQRSANTSSDSRGSVLYRPDTLAKISDVGFDLNRFAYEITALQNQAPEIGIIWSEANMINNLNSMVPVYESYAGAVHNGKRVRFITDYNTAGIHDMKLVVVPNVRFIKGETLAEIKKFIENGGKVIVIGEDTLTLDEHNLPNDSETVNFVMNNSKVVPHIEDRITPISPTPDEYTNIIGDMLSEMNIDYIRVVDAESGERVNDVEYNSAVYNGKVIINLSNTSEAKNIKVYAGDTLVTGAKELRTGEVLGDVIELGKYKVALLETSLENPFIDTYGHWGENEILGLYKEGVVNGRSESIYDPEGTTTRWEFHALLSRAAGKTLSDYNPESETFRPNDKITREEMCEMLIKYYEAVKGEITDDKTVTFKDIVNDSESVSKAVSAGLMQGRADGTFDGSGNATRAEAAAVISRFLK